MTGIRESVEESLKSRSRASIQELYDDAVERGVFPSDMDVQTRKHRIRSSLSSLKEKGQADNPDVGIGELSG